VEVARALAGAFVDQTAFPHGVFFVPLAAVNDADALVPTIGRALPFSFHGEANPVPRRVDQADAKEQLLDYLRQKRLLLVLDNFEHLLAPAVVPHAGREGGAETLLIEVLRAAPGAKLLITSREGLNLQPEWSFPLGGMAYPSQDGAGEDGVALSQEAYSAVALFDQCARRVCPGFALADHRPAVARICQLVDGMPLAIEMAAAWLKLLSPDRIVAELARGLDILSTSLRDVEPRHRSMRAVFDHSWGLLSEKERSVLERLAVFRGGFRLRAAEAVAGASLPDLAGLVTKSLLPVTSGRYQMHNLFRQYALERLWANAGEEREARDRHSAYYARFFHGHGEGLKGPDQQKVLVEMDAEIDNARTAWTWMAEQRQVERLDQMLEGFCLYYARRLRAREGEAACQLAADKLGSAEGSAGPVPGGAGGLKVLSRILAWQARFCASEQAERAERLLAMSLSLLERPELVGEDTRQERAFALQQMGRWASITDLQRARSLYEHSLALYRTLGARWWMANILEQLGWIAAFVGEYEESIGRHRESLAIRRVLGDPSGIAESYRGLSMLGMVGDFEAGIQSIRECIAIWRKLGEKAGLAGGLNQLATGLVLTGAYAETFDVLEESLAICRDLGLRRDETWVDTWRAVAELHAGRYKRARSLGERALSFSRELGDLEFTGRCLWLLGEVALAQEAYAEAQSLLEESFTTYKRYGLPNEMAWALADLALAARGLGQKRRSRQHLGEAMRVAVEKRAVLSLPWILPKAALFLADAGDAELAVELYALALRYPGVSNSHWFEDVVGGHVMTATAKLPPEVVAAAQERGRGRDLEATAKELVVELGG
jgi:predicted ATPase